MLSFLLFTVVTILVATVFIKVSDKHSQQDQDAINAYRKATGNYLDKTYMVKNSIKIGLDSPRDSALDSILKNYRCKTLLFFIDKGILVLKRFKNQLKSYQLIPYSDITKYYYKVYESHSSHQTNITGTINILLNKGTIQISDIDMDNEDKPLLFGQLDIHTTKQQRVAPTHNIGMTLSWVSRDSFRYKVKHYIQTNNDIRWHHIITRALIQDSMNAHKRIKKYLS